MNLQGGNIVILGATSAIAKGSCKALIEQGATLYLASRDVEELERLATDLNIRYSTAIPVLRSDRYIYTDRFDAEDFASHAGFFGRALKTLGKIDGLLMAFGYLGNPDLYWDFTEQKHILNQNLFGAISILSYFADYFEEQKNGFIIGISSVAGDRSLKKNYSYDTAKGGLSIYLQGLRNRLFKKNVRVITVKPGFVDTPMTFGKADMFLVADPEKTGRRIVKQLVKSRDVIYVPWFWRYIMLIIRLIPEALSKRLSWRM